MERLIQKWESCENGKMPRRGRHSAVRLLAVTKCALAFAPSSGLAVLNIERESGAPEGLAFWASEQAAKPTSTIRETLLLDLLF
jgi:hypothetical protein